MTAEQLDESMFLLRRAAIERRWVLKRSIKSFFKTHSLSTALFVHGMNMGFYRMSKFQVARDRSRFGHLLDCKPLVFPD